MASVSEARLPKHHEATQSEKLVITASSLGTVFEWYDFYLYGLLATVISAQFFSGVNETTGFIFALAAFALAAAVRLAAGLRPALRAGLALAADFFGAFMINSPPSAMSNHGE